MEVKGKKVTVIKTFDVYYSGWDCDSKGYIVVLEDGNKSAVLTDHGNPYFADVSELESLIIEYKSAANETMSAIELLK